MPVLVLLCISPFLYLKANLAPSIYVTPLPSAVHPRPRYTLVLAFAPVADIWRQGADGGGGALVDPPNTKLYLRRSSSTRVR